MLSKVPGLVFPELDRPVSPNFAYFPVLIKREYGLSRDRVHALLKQCNIHARKYFYPLASRYSCYRALPSAAPDQLPIAEQFANQVLCLPMFGSLPNVTVDAIANLLAELPSAVDDVPVA